MRLAVHLNDIEVAQLERRADGNVELEFLDSYRDLRHRPVLSLFYLDKLRRRLPPTSGLPAFFTNLLPESDGPLRRLIAQAAGIREHQDLRLLAHLGDDLPGAVVVRLIDETGDDTAMK